MSSNYFECCSRVNPSDSVPEALSNIIIYNKKQDDEIAKKANKDDLSEVAKSGRYYDLIDKPVALPNPKPITINGQRYDGSEAVTVTVSGEGGGTPVEIDDTLTQSGKAADAKATGDALNALNGANAQQDTEIAKKANADDLAVVAKSGSYNDLNNKPTIPTVPSALPNPNKLKLTGAVTAEYDGSAEVSVEIPAVGGGSYTLPIASPNTLGGVMPAAKTDEMTQAVGVDANGQLFTVPGSGGGGTPVEIDDTLTQSGKAADAKATGDALNALNGANAQQDTEIAKKANADDLAVVAKSGSYNDLNNKPTIPTVPSALPNPNKLKLTGAVTAEYDGSAEVSVEIPAVGGGSYTLPIASPNTLGGVMPAAKTDEMTQAVGVDANGQLFTVPGSGGGGSSEWRLLKTITTEADVQEITFDTDNEGNPFLVKEIHMWSEVKGLTSNTGSSSIQLRSQGKKFVSPASIHKNDSINYSVCHWNLVTGECIRVTSKPYKNEYGPGYYTGGTYAPDGLSSITLAVLWTNEGSIGAGSIFNIYAR